MIRSSPYMHKLVHCLYVSIYI